ncbi:hypothetical protein EV193_101589 [Herbihabitans rhizosphaerae]|uniref:Uncharacterized protein n=1 Tax=Herbihabitans rhizosphaerae TaxID=1872711 RepID=A0A4Q7L8I4_9PSEU|nr:hypothetical protein [Herbihabitans rhizosphaerae]RZS44712.1 hypothetical protein EV193_101589 [Herbihabitans rhizosphaerae]
MTARDVLARLGFVREPHTWTVPGRDEHGHRVRLKVRASETGVSITVPQSGAIRLHPLDAGRLRRALREAVLAYAALNRDETGSAEVTLPLAS